MAIDQENPVVKLCVEGMALETAGNVDAAHALFDQAWALCQNDFDACMVAHFLARHRPPTESLVWNQRALDHALAVNDERVQGFFPSLYLNLGWSHEIMGDRVAARRYYALAADQAATLPVGSYAEVVRRGIAAGQKRLATDEGCNV